MNRIDLIKRAYRCLDYVTPLSFDCGALCGGACCRGDGEIWLLPGESELFADSESFEIKRFSDGDERLICRESCALRREERPFYCRIFPLIPKIEKVDGGAVKVKIYLDPRAVPLCPLANGLLPTRRFERAVGHAVRILCQDEEIAEHFIACTDFLSEMERFKARLFDDKDEGGNG